MIQMDGSGSSQLRIGRVVHGDISSDPVRCGKFVEHLAYH
jgi:hypothetical protein